MDSLYPDLQESGIDQESVNLITSLMTAFWKILIRTLKKLAILIFPKKLDDRITRAPFIK